MAKAEEMKQSIIFFSVDIRSFFDRENIVDCIEAMKDAKVNNKAIRIWYNMNKDTLIKVNTTVGISSDCYVGDCVAQGTISAALVSAINLDSGICKAFARTNSNFFFDKIKFLPLTYQDDIDDICKNVGTLKDHAGLIKDML